MNWEAIGAIADLASAVGVVATLGYLAFQIRQNTRTVFAESQRALFGSTAQTSLQLAQDENLARLLRKGLADFGALSAEERTRFSFLMGNLIGSASIAHGSTQYGAYTAEPLMGAMTPALRFLRTPGGRAWWRIYAMSFSRPFRDFVDHDLMRSGQDASPTAQASSG